jgi:rubrerythrin
MAAQPPSTPPGDLPRIRQALARALETVSLYEASAADASSDEVRDFFTHLANEQKEHVVEAVAMLRKLDGTFDALFGKDYTPEYFQKPLEVPLPSEKTLERIAREPGRAVHAMPAPPSPTAGPLTVGSLRKRGHIG